MSCALDRAWWRLWKEIRALGVESAALAAAGGSPDEIARLDGRIEALRVRTSLYAEMIRRTESERGSPPDGPTRS